MKEIELIHGHKTLIDDEDFEYLSQWNWTMFSVGDSHYACRYSKRKKILMHRVIMEADMGQEVDHRNGSGLDNQRINLRLCTHAENMRNRKLNKNSTSGYKGVIPYRCRGILKDAWEVKIKCEGTDIGLGVFHDPLEAAYVYDQAAIQLHGDFASLNIL